MSLFKVTVSTSIMVSAANKEQAESIAKSFASAEITNYCDVHSKIITVPNDIPEEWKNYIPYYPQNIVPNPHTCQQIIENTFKSIIPKDTKDDITVEDVENIIKIQGGIKGTIEDKTERINAKSKIESIKDKTESWRENKSGRILPKLRFDF